MSDGKIEFKLGSIEFKGEGSQEWVTKQLDKIIEKAPSLLKIAPTEQQTPRDHTPMGSDPQIASQTLVKFLKEKNATTNQVTKYLATAVWLEAKGKKRLTTPDITKALKDSSQSRLGNASDCLNKNITKGFCEKEGKEFFVTEDGKNSL
jgi:hypothetical protein